MPSLTFHQYGKTQVRLTQILRRADRHEVIELSAQILFQGDFDESYTTADNSRVLPTDTIKNSVYVLARRHGIDSIEDFGLQIARFFLKREEQVRRIEVSLEQPPWARIGEHGGAFVLGGPDCRTARIIATRDGEQVTSGIRELEILKTSKSAFSGYKKDEFTTLPETRDRLLGTVLDAEWTYRTVSVDFNAEYQRTRLILLETFAAHVSESVQHTLYDMAAAALAASPALSEVHLVMPNKHRLLFNLERFGLDNPNEIFVATDEPSGYIEARVSAL